MALIEPKVAQGLAAAAGVESVDTFAASVISSELESRLRQVVAEAMDVQRHTLEPRLTGAHVMAALKQHALPVSLGALALCCVVPAARTGCCRKLACSPHTWPSFRLQATHLARSWRV